MKSFPRPGNWLFIVPWIAFIPWYGMLITMLICWAAEGHPVYWFMHTHQFPVYISDIGATNLEPLFISCCAWQGLGYAITVALEYFQRSGHWPFALPHVTDADVLKLEHVSRDRASSTSTSSTGGSSSPTKHPKNTYYVEALVQHKYVMPPFFTKHERNLVWASFVLACIGELALLMCTIFSTNTYPKVHRSMVGIFCAGFGLSAVCNIAQYTTMGRHYAVVHPLCAAQDLGAETRWNHWRGHVWNKYTISGCVKSFWLVAAFTWAICFCAVPNDSTNACFEWLLAFWFGLYFMVVSVDWYIGGRYRVSKYFNQIIISDNLSFYKYEQLKEKGVESV